MKIYNDVTLRTIYKLFCINICSTVYYLVHYNNRSKINTFVYECIIMMIMINSRSK